MICSQAGLGKVEARSEREVAGQVRLHSPIELAGAEAGRCRRWGPVRNGDSDVEVDADDSRKE